MDIKQLKYKLEKAKEDGEKTINGFLRSTLLHKIFVIIWLFVVGLIVISILDIFCITKFQNFTNYDIFIKICSFIPIDQSFFVGNSSESARYLLSTIAQVQAAIIAIIVSLTILAVQLTSQSYSPRAIELFRNFRKNYPFWLLLAFYIVSIMYDVIILGTIGNPNKIDNQLMYRISFAIFLTGAAIIALVPYTRDVMDKFKPENIIKRIIEEIDAKELVKNINETNKRKKKENKDYIYTSEDLKEDDKTIVIVDIILNAIQNGNSFTAKSGIDELNKFFENMYEKEKLNESKKNLILHFSRHFIRIGNRAVVMEDEESGIRICKVLENLGKQLIKDELEIEKYLFSIDITYKEDLKNIFFSNKLKEEFEKKLSLCTEMFVIEEGDNCWRIKDENATYNIKEIDAQLKVSGVDKKIIEKILFYIGMIGVKSAKKRQYIVALKSVSCFEGINKVAEEKEQNDITDDIIFHIRNICAMSVEKRIEMSAFEAIRFLKKIGVGAAKSKIKYRIINVVGYLTHIVTFAKKDFRTINQLIDALIEIGIISAENNTENKLIIPMSMVIGFLREYGADIIKEDRQSFIVIVIGISKIAVSLIMNKEDSSYLIKTLNKLYEKSPELVPFAIRKFEEDIKQEGNKSKLDAFQEFKNKLDFLNKKP